MKANKEEFAKLMVVLRRSYPGSFFDDGEWGGTIQTWWKRFQHYPIRVLCDAFHAAVDRYPKKFPTLGQVSIVVEDYYGDDVRRRTADNRGKFLPAPEQGRDGSLASFFKMCGDALEMPCQDLTDPDTAALLEGVLVALGGTFGMSRDDIMGNVFGEDSQDRFSLSRSLIAIWKTKGYELRSITEGLREVPTKCKKWPTERLIDDLIHGRDVAYGWPEEFVYTDERVG